jgi:hypothetical protein
VVTCSDISKEPTASIFKVTKLVRVDAEGVLMDISVGYIEKLKVAGPITAMGDRQRKRDCPKPMESRFQDLHPLYF